MTNPAILLKDGRECPEGIMDAFIVSTACIMISEKREFSMWFNIYC